ncbi:TlpA family protein disulfide reductase [Thermogutta sp.]|uniref:TlpA family protein disulfide reductase n=1 Tax=Thermogutta sp. TaxID=1962930 RepID=UPI003C7D6EB3
MSRSWRILGILMVVVVFGLAGCQASKNETPQKSESQQSASDAKQTAVKLPELVVEVGDEKDLDAILKENTGKVVLVDFWGTWCMPCLELLPHTLELAHKYAAEGLVVVTVAIEDINDPRKVDEVKGVLVKHGATGNVRALVSRYGIGEEAFTKFNIASGALPHLKLFGRDGALAVTFGLDAEKPDPARIEAEVQRLLKETAASQSQSVEGPELVIPEVNSSMSYASGSAS